jgi:hypothetical protein
MNWRGKPSGTGFLRWREIKITKRCVKERIEEVGVRQKTR